MGRKHTFYDREFGREDYEEDDPGDYEENLVFVVMPFIGEGMDEVYATIAAGCRDLQLRPERVDRVSGSGFGFPVARFVFIPLQR